MKNKKHKLRTKSKKEIIEWLENNGYEKIVSGKNYLYQKSNRSSTPYFCDVMFDFCDREIKSFKKSAYGYVAFGWTWFPEWIEEVPSKKE